MSDKTILAIDQGTTSSRAILFSRSGDILDVQQKELSMTYPQKGWVEQDARDIWADTLWAVQEILKNAGAEAARIAGIGITNQRETTILWDRRTGEPIHNAIVWQDRRTADMCRRLKEAGHEDIVRQKTGLLLDPYFSGTKISWLLDQVPDARARAEREELAFGTVDSYLLWMLTGGKVHATDITNASRTLLYNICEERWDEDLLKLFDIPVSLLPEVYENAHQFGLAKIDGADREIPICGIAGDQQAALIGQACFEHGMVKSTYGTGCFALMNIGPKFKASENRLLTTPGYKIDGALRYALEGSIFVAGAAIQWLRDGLMFFDNAAESEALARSVPDANGVYFVPAFTGLGAPYWMPEARALISGMTRETTKAHIARAALEAQGYQTLDLMEAMVKDSGVDPACIRADGGLVHNAFMCEFLADILGTPVEIPRFVETTAWGAACLAGLQSGLYKDLDEVSATWQMNKRYVPKMSATDRAACVQGWRNVIHMLIR